MTEKTELFKNPVTTLISLIKTEDLQSVHLNSGGVSLKFELIYDGNYTQVKDLVSLQVSIHGNLKLELMFRIRDEKDNDELFTRLEKIALAVELLR